MNSQEALALEKKYGSMNYAPLPVVLTRGEGVFLWDLEQKKYFDFMSGYSAVSQGHCHPKIVKAIQEQAARLTMVSRALYSDQMGPFAQLATELFGYERVLMMNSGAEAFETAVKMARKWGYQKKNVPTDFATVVVCNDNFHGRTMGAVSASSNAAHHKVFGPIMPGFARIPYDDLSALKAALDNPSVVAFIVEPIQGEAGVNVPRDGYLREAATLCRDANVLFIADEIQTGIARTGRLLCCQYEGVRADITLLGKALSGGMFPVSAVLADTSVMECLQPGDHGSTFGGNPLACHVAIASLEVIVDEKLSENASRMGEMFRGGIRELNSPLIKQVRGKGLLNAVEFDFVSNGMTDPQAGHHLCEAFLREGLIAKTTRPQIIRFAPPLVITEAEMRAGLEIIGRVILGFGKN